MSGFQSHYLIDGEDRILDWGGPAWEALAGPRADLTGDRIYEHVAGHFTQRFLRTFFVAARAAPAGLARHYRCDSPSRKRLMEMRAEPMADGGLRVAHWLIEETPMAFEVETRETRGARRVGHIRCSICNRLRPCGTREWREPDAVAHSPGPVAVIHTVCPECRNGVKARIPLSIPAASEQSRRPTAPPSSS